MSAIIGMIMVFHTVSAGAASTAAPVPKNGDRAYQAAISEDGSKWRRDPFHVGDAKNGTAPAGKIPAGLKTSTAIVRSHELDIQGIIQSDNAFHALINGNVVKTGDKLDGLTIMEISRYRVVVKNDNNEKIIYDIYQGRIDRGKQ